MASSFLTVSFSQSAGSGGLCSAGKSAGAIWNRGRWHRLWENSDTGDLFKSTRKVQNVMWNKVAWKDSTIIQKVFEDEDAHGGSVFHRILIATSRTGMAVATKRNKLQMFTSQWWQKYMAPPKEGSLQWIILSIFLQDIHKTIMNENVTKETPHDWGARELNRQSLFL